MATSFQLTPRRVASLCGVSEGLLEAAAPQPWPDLSYRVLAGAERDGVVLSIIEEMDKRLRVVGANDNTVWERGWGEIRDRIQGSGFDPELLRPQYFEHHRILRLDGDWIAAEHADFGYRYDQILRRIVFRGWLGDAARVVELGCGTGNSLLLLGQMFPQTGLVGSDWATPSQELVRLIGAHLERPIDAVRFNMLDLSGWADLGIDRETAVLTVHSLEQLGPNHEQLLDRLIAAKPSLCLHLEPIAELYDPTKLFDALAFRYHRQRNYLDGWLAALRRRAAAGDLELLEERRLKFGDRYHEAYTIVAWRPK